MLLFCPFRRSQAGRPFLLFVSKYRPPSACVISRQWALRGSLARVIAIINSYSPRCRPPRAPASLVDTSHMGGRNLQKPAAAKQGAKSRPEISHRRGKSWRKSSVSKSKKGVGEGAQAHPKRQQCAAAREGCGHGGRDCSRGGAARSLPDGGEDRGRRRLAAGEARRGPRH